MSALTSFHDFRYPFSSELILQNRNRVLRLATFHQEKGRDIHPFFFEGKLSQPKRTAEMLRALMKVVQSRFHIPAMMLAGIMRNSDPVVTCNDELVRFEGFSACAGVYVRLDLEPASFIGDRTGRGTTNVDFNHPMLAALARIKKTDQVGISIGAEQVVLEKESGNVVEKRVELPVRWMKGFVEVQAVQKRMDHCFSVPGMDAFRFFRSLPRMKTHRRKTYVTQAGKGLRLSQVPVSTGVSVGGLERLEVLETMSKSARKLDVFADKSTGASGWVLQFDDCKFHVVISPEVWRGFSGEGQALSAIAKQRKQELAKIRALLQWQNVIDEISISKMLKAEQEAVAESLMVLGARGLVGFDLSTRSYFHRQMPFDVSLVEKLQPRLKSARKLLEVSKLSVRKKNSLTVEVLVPSQDIKHRVTLSIAKQTAKAGDATVPEKCTCPWFSQHQGKRGPCKHILAAQIFLEEKEH